MTPPPLQEVSPSLNDLVTPQARSDDVDGLVGSESVASIVDDESSTENKLDTPFPLETIKVEISTPPDFKDIYYEIATIKSPYTFQVSVFILLLSDVNDRGEDRINFVFHVRSEVLRTHVTSR